MSELRQREPRRLDPGFLAFLRKRGCAFCGARPAEAAHIRMGNITFGKPDTGMQERPDDRWAIPLCAWCHREGPYAQHKIGEERFWRMVGANPFILAGALYQEYGGDGGHPQKKRTAIKPRLPKEKRRKVPKRRSRWAKRPFANNTRTS